MKRSDRKLNTETERWMDRLRRFLYISLSWTLLPGILAVYFFSNMVKAGIYPTLLSPPFLGILTIIIGDLLLLGYYFATIRPPKIAKVLLWVVSALYNIAFVAFSVYFVVAIGLLEVLSFGGPALWLPMIFLPIFFSAGVVILSIAEALLQIQLLRKDVEAASQLNLAREISSYQSAS